MAPCQWPMAGMLISASSSSLFFLFLHSSCGCGRPVAALHAAGRGEEMRDQNQIRSRRAKFKVRSSSVRCC
jgi:hypothetical protein